MNQNALDSDMTQFIHAMPKAEIHIHLEGAIQPETVLKLARRHNQLHQLPATDAKTLQRWFKFTDFRHFIKIYVTIQDLIRTAADFALIVYENGADMAAQNIRYRELTVTTYTHTDFQDKGLTIDDILRGLDDGRQQARRDFGVEMRWVFDIPRNLAFGDDGKTYRPECGQRAVEHAISGQVVGVVGFGLGGNEVGAPPEPFAPAFTRAREAGLLSVPHAGEMMGPESVWGCIQELQADRIGHGVRAIEDPALLKLLQERQIPLEINPTSNIRLGIYDSLANHPFPRLDEMGLLVTVNSDDPPLFNTNLRREYEILARDFGYDKANLARIARNAFVVSGAEPDVKARLLAEFDDWVARNR
jgi:aminodeoxyfutalosine deaminase